MSHEGRIVHVRNQHGYDVGHSAVCDCGWQSGELVDTPGAALIEHFRHLMALREKETA